MQILLELPHMFIYVQRNSWPLLVSSLSISPLNTGCYTGEKEEGGGGRGAVRSPTEQVAMGATYIYTIEIVPPYAFLVNLVPDLTLIDLESGKEIITPFVRPSPY